MAYNGRIIAAGGVKVLLPFLRKYSKLVAKLFKCAISAPTCGNYLLRAGV